MDTNTPRQILTDPTSPPPSLAFLTHLQRLFFISGLSSLVLEVAYVRVLRYWVGNTTYAVAAVLCAYMAGLSAGSLVAGKLCLRRRRLLALYGGMELLVGWYSLGLPWAIKQFEPAYLTLTGILGPDSHRALFAHSALGVMVLLLPTLLIGGTFPVLVRVGSGLSTDRAQVAEQLYYTNLLGAAIGALLSDFLLIRFWGLGNTLFLVAILNSCIALSAIGLDCRHTAKGPNEPKESTLSKDSPVRPALKMILLTAFSGGLLVLFIEIVWINMAGRFLDNTAYGFAVTLFAVIAGLGAGAGIVSRLLISKSAAKALPCVFLGAGFAVSLLIPLWGYSSSLAAKYPFWCGALAFVLTSAVVFAVDNRPKALAWYMGTILALILAVSVWPWLDPEGVHFWLHHGLRFSVFTLFNLGPAVLAGMIFPLVLKWYLDEARGFSRTVAGVYAVNTAGSLAGIVAATFLVLPRLGVERSGRAAGLGFLAMGWLLLVRHRGRLRWAIGAASVAALVWALYAPSWDFTRTLHVRNRPGLELYSGEDLNVGVTTVLQNKDERAIFVNDLFNGGTGTEERDQVRLALVPLLYAHEFDRAMVIGVGTGQTAGILGQFPFRPIEVVDLSPRVMESAKTFFPALNLDIFKDPRLSTHIADGRHYLLVHPQRLSFLTIEVSRLWIAGEGDLYTREFYEICSRRLTDRGVLQQWVPLFSLTVPETLIILRTVRSVFPYVALYLGGESGMLVASRVPLETSYTRLQEIDSNPRLATALERIGLPRASSLLGDLCLDPAQMDAFLARVSEQRIATDLWPYLEHSVAYHRSPGQSSALSVWDFLMTATEYRLPTVIGAAPAAMSEVRKSASEERERQSAAHIHP